MIRLKKRMIAATAAGTMMLGLLSGCGNTEKDENITASVEQQTTAATTEAATEKVTEPVTEAVQEDDWSTAVDAELTVKKLPVSDDFIMGVDVSSFISEIESGVTYYDFDGNELDDQGFFNFLADCGINAVRVRVWNEPYDLSSQKTYGGGHCDLETAEKIGTLATNAGISMIVDFHYSDFWADPGKQRAPKAWENMELDEKAERLGEMTENYLSEMLNLGIDISMVQIGNETSYGMCGETEWEDITILMKSASEAIRSVADKYDAGVKIAVHFTNPENENYDFYAKTLDDADLDYDVFASSWYSYWHGTTSNLTKQLSGVAEKYGKEVMVMETSYIHTFLDGDGQGNTEGYGKPGDKFNYDISEQGQADAVYAAAKAVADCGESGIGVCYWEPAWIPVNVVVSEEDYKEGNYLAEIDEEAYALNRMAWEEFGSGWASVASQDYDDDAVGTYGGSAVDNEALFDFWGYPLESLKVFSYLRTGAKAPLRPLRAVADDLTIDFGAESWILPAKADVYYNDGTIEKTEILWDDGSDESVDVNAAGIYQVTGAVIAGDSTIPVSVSVTVTPQNILPNAGFEDADMSMWEISSSVISRKDDSNNVRSGKYCLHFWDAGEIEYTVEQKIVLDAGTYTFGGWVEGGDVGDAAEMAIYAVIGDEVYEMPTMVTAWQEWKNPELTDLEIAEDGTEITLGLRAKTAAGGWGAWDDFYLYPEN